MTITSFYLFCVRLEKLIEAKLRADVRNLQEEARREATMF